MRMARVLIAGLVMLLVGTGWAAALQYGDYGTYYTAGKVWYYLYLNQNSTFTELYEKALDAGVDNETLALALELQANSTELFNEAISVGTPDEGRIPMPWKVRKAYLMIKEAVGILAEALE